MLSTTVTTTPLGRYRSTVQAYYPSMRTIHCAIKHPMSMNKFSVPWLNCPAALSISAPKLAFSPKSATEPAPISLLRLSVILEPVRHLVVAHYRVDPKSFYRPQIMDIWGVCPILALDPLPTVSEINKLLRPASQRRLLSLIRTQV